jgi:hypothetical protein
VPTAGKVEGLVTFTVVGVRISLVASKALYERPFPCRRGRYTVTGGCLGRLSVMTVDHEAPETAREQPTPAVRSAVLHAFNYGSSLADLALRFSGEKAAPGKSHTFGCMNRGRGVVTRAR